MRLRTVAGALLVAALVGCASPGPAPAAYVGVFTGQFIDGLPLYRLPAIEVVGSRAGMDAPRH